MSLITADIGDRITLRGTLRDEAGAVVSGATVTVKALAPGDTTPTTVGTATEVGSTGVYEITYDPTVEGATLIRFESALPYKAAAEGVVYARETRFS